MNKALFLDRDGVINEDTEYLFRIEDVRFCPGIFDFCREANVNGFLIIVVTNQSGVARGYFTEQDVRTLHEWMRKEFASQGVRITDFFYCPYHIQGTIPRYTRESPSRKPKPGMILEAAGKWNIDLAQSSMIGDKPSDRIKLPELRSYILKSAYCKDNYDFESLDALRRFLFEIPTKTQ